ncbi:MAG TPA: flavodoxin [Trueperaceae bacterium]|nr:flavodoxin [Trueperaceae bacterium]
MNEHQPPRAIVIYSGMFGATESCAELVADVLAARLGRAVPCRDVSWFDLTELAAYDLVVLGAATWNIGQLPYGWSDKLADLGRFDLSGKTVALFGTGDQVGYPETFLDAVGMVAEAAGEAGAELVGSWPTAGYHFIGSRAVKGERFVGLALDDDNQPELTAPRIADWVHLVLDEMEQVDSSGPASSTIAMPG